MHPSVIGIRNEAARRKITAAAAALADALELPALEQPTSIELRQPAVSQMRELEHIAALLDNVAAALIGANNEPKERPR